MTELPSWLVVVLSLSGPVLGIAGVTLGHVLAQRAARQERVAAYQQSQRHAAFEGLGKASTLIADVSPVTMKHYADCGDARPRAAAFTEQWADIRPSLSIAMLAHPDAPVREALGKATRAVSALMLQAWLYAETTTITGAHSGEAEVQLAQLKADRDEAIRLSKVATELLHREGA